MAASTDEIQGDKVDRDSVEVNVHPPGGDDKVIDHLLYQTKVLTELQRDLRGNGNPGLYRRVSMLERMTVYQWIILALFALYDLVREIVRVVSQ